MFVTVSRVTSNPLQKVGTETSSSIQLHSRYIRRAFITTEELSILELNYQMLACLLGGISVDVFFPIRKVVVEMNGTYHYLSNAS
jgi:hypothetical protein